MNSAATSESAAAAANRKTPLPLLARFLSSSGTCAVVVAGTVAIAVFAGALSADRGLFDPDEEIYLRVIKMFDGGLSLDLLQTYGGEPASPAPLFFIIYSWFGRLFGTEFPVFRTLSLLLTIAAVGVAWAFVHFAGDDRRNGDRRLYFLSLLLLYPYIFSMAFSVMAEPLTLFLTVVTLCAYQRALTRESTLALVTGTLAVSAALYVRPHALFAPAALMLTLALRKDRSPLLWIFAAAPILMRIPLFLLQGGFTVNREAFTYTKPELGFCPSHVNFFLVWFGYLFFPLLWWCRGRWRATMLATLLLVPFYFWVAPDFLAPQHKGAIRTMFLYFGFGPTLCKVIAFPAWFAGCYLTVDLILRVLSEDSVRDRFLVGAIVAFMASLVFSTVAFERYYQLVVPAVVLLGVAPTCRFSGYVAVAGCHLLYLALAALRVAADLA